MINVDINAGICGFTTRVSAEKTSGYKGTFSLDSQCPNWQKVAESFADSEIDMMTELFKDKESGKVNSRIISTALSTIPHVSCPVISGILKALEVSVGLALPKDASIKFIDQS
jgi:hypothetical protein